MSNVKNYRDIHFKEYKKNKSALFRYHYQHFLAWVFGEASDCP